MNQTMDVMIARGCYFSGLAWVKNKIDVKLAIPPLKHRQKREKVDQESVAKLVLFRSDTVYMELASAVNGATCHSCAFD